MAEIFNISPGSYVQSFLFFKNSSTGCFPGSCLSKVEALVLEDCDLLFYAPRNFLLTSDICTCTKVNGYEPEFFS